MGNTQDIKNRKLVNGEHYAAVGPRQISENVASLCYSMGMAMGQDGWHLRSSHSAGCCVSFEMGAEEARAPITLYLPWKSYGENVTTRPDLQRIVVSSKVPEIDSICKHCAPKWNEQPGGVRKLMRRHVACLLGLQLDNPVKCLMCWMPKTESPTGASFVVAVAQLNNIPLINLSEVAPDIALDMAMTSL